jgi:FAD-linked sulfhydryl oxidase
LFEIIEVDISAPKPEPKPEPEPKTVSKSKSALKENPSQYTKDPKNWGPHLWYYLHTAAANYPKRPSKDQKNNMKQWLVSLTTTIPCRDCSNHYGSYINKHRHSLDEICGDRDKLFNFLVDCHNNVNKRNNKKQVSYSEAKEIFNPGQCTSCSISD